MGKMAEIGTPPRLLKLAVPDRSPDMRMKGKDMDIDL
jgi:hypothetical protein